MKPGKILTSILLAGTIVLASCSDWLDVKPKQSVEEEELFSREIGFKEALTGVYIKMASTTLYGRNLSYGFLDILAQRYDPKDVYNKHPFQEALYYTFPSELTESTTNSIWSGMYNVIANINNLLYWTDNNKSVFTTEHYYEIIKGEALGLRGFLHFDLLRMYGPVYKERPDGASITYRSVFDRNSNRILPARVAADSIITDLKAAEKILADVDPLSFEFPQNQNEEDLMPGDRFLVYRHKRMNLMAVKATLARVYLYIGDKVNAAKYAQEVIDAHTFSLVSNNVIDRLFSSEIIFSVYIDKLKEQVERDFSHNYGQFWIADREVLNEMFDVSTDGANDLRYREGTGFDVDEIGAVSKKYDQSGAWVSLEGTIPLIRLPEMYYILAECSDDLEVAASWLNTVREIRGVMAVAVTDEQEKQQEIMKEYRKEFYGEGQLFYFYKRHFYKTILNCPVDQLVESNYIFSLPEDEVLFGQAN